MYFCVNEFEVGVNGTFSGNEQQKVEYFARSLDCSVKSENKVFPVRTDHAR